MDLKAALRALEAKGKLSGRKAYARAGVTGSCFGVPVADIDALAKELKIDHALALQLWDSGTFEARLLATRIVDTSAIDDATVLRWLDDVDNFTLAESVALPIAGMPHGLALARRLIDADAEWPGAVGWAALAKLVSGGVLDNALVAQLLTRVEHTLHTAPNWTRHAMNRFVIDVGASRISLRDQALTVAKAIGSVAVDHGESGGKTPDATASIEKAAASERTAAAKAERAKRKQ